MSCQGMINLKLFVLSHLKSSLIYVPLVWHDDYGKIHFPIQPLAANKHPNQGAKSSFTIIRVFQLMMVHPNHHVPLPPLTPPIHPLWYTSNEEVNEPTPHPLNSPLLAIIWSLLPYSCFNHKSSLTHFWLNSLN